MLASSAEKASMLAEQRVFVYDISLRKRMIGTTNHQYRIGRLRKSDPIVNCPSISSDSRSWKHFKRKANGVTVVMNVRTSTNLSVFIATINRLQYVLSKFVRSPFKEKRDK